MLLAWPSILVPSSEKWNPNTNPSRGGGRSVLNQEQVVAAPTGYVSASLTIPCPDRARVLAMRALLAGLDGRAGSVLVGPREVGRAPWNIDPLTGGRISYAQGARDAAIDPAFETNTDTTSALDFRVSGGAPMNATSMVVQRGHGGVIEPGMMFSIDSRLHIVTALPNGELAAPGSPGPPGMISVQFRPWLRADYADGTAIEFGTPLATMRLASDDTGAMELQLSRTGVVAIDLVEAF